MAAIELRGVSKHFGDITAVDDLDLTVEEGEIYGFLGPNGAGKSTTINMLLDFVRPSQGTITVLGEDVRTNSVGIRKQTGVLPEGFGLYDRLTARQHVQFAIDSKALNLSVDAEDVLHRVGLEEAIDRKTAGFSSGMRQRLALGMALVGEPELLILDEPSSGLDPNGAREMREIVREEADRGATIFFSSHILGQVEAVCDRVGILTEGELVAEDSIEGLRDRLGTASRLEVTVDKVDDALIEALEADPVVESVRADGTVLEVECDRSAKSTVLEIIEENGREVIDFQTTEASLEELFHNYTVGEEP